MVWVFFIAVAAIVVVAIAALAVGRVEVDPVPPPVTTTPSTGLEPGFRAADIHDVRFDTALRGYRMDQVDDVLDALHARIDELESRRAPAADAPAVEAGDPAPAPPAGDRDEQVP